VKKALLSDLLNLSARERMALAAALWDSLAPGDREAELRTLIADVTQRRRDEIDLDARIADQGIDSLQLIILRERLQSTFRIVFSDDEWAALRTPAEILARTPAPFPERQPEASRASASSAGLSNSPITVTSKGSVCRVELEIGMPLTGRNNLAETPLLQYLGDLRWRQISDLMGVPTRDIADEHGERLYATFFYVDVAFPPARPMASFGENDRLQVISSLARYGTSMVDGTCYLVSADANDAARDVVDADAGLDAAISAGVPAARLSNIFVKQFGGAEWLKKARPAHPGFLRIAEMLDPPDSYAITKQAEQTGAFALPEAGWSPMTSGAVTREYRLLPDRDLNGAGLVYFANYPIFLDICERDVLATARLPLSDSLIDRRTVLRRRSAYLNNASAKDSLRIELEPWLRVENDAAAGPDGPIDLHLHVNCRIYRQSDSRLMMVSGVRKVVPSVDAGAISWLRRRGASGVSIGG